MEGGQKACQSDEDIRIRRRLVRKENEQERVQTGAITKNLRKSKKLAQQESAHGLGCWGKMNYH